MKQTLCPYSRSLLGSEGNINREHVTPVAIGAPNRFYVNSHQNLNSEWNDKIDSPFSNNTGIRFLAMTEGVQSRSGLITSTLDGKIMESGDLVGVSLQHNGELDIHHRKPVTKQDGRYLVKGWGNRVQIEVDKLEKNLLKKGYSITETLYSELNNPTIQSEINFNGELCNLQLIKTAYLYTVWCLGDKAITSKSSCQYLQALNSGKIYHNGSLNLHSTKAGFHQFSLLVYNGLAYCHVSLFGVFSNTFCTKIDIEKHYFGQMTAVEIKNSSFTEEKDQEKLLYLFCQEMAF